MTLKALAVAGCAGALLFAGPALADPSGYVSIGVGPANYSFSTGADDLGGRSISALASGAYMFTPVLGVQGDVSIDETLLPVEDFTNKVIRYDGALHGFYRDADRFLVGGFLQVGHTDLDFAAGGSLGRAYVGGEAQLYFDKVTLYGQLGRHTAHIESDFGTPIDSSGWFGVLEMRYFLTPNLRIEGHTGGATSDLALPTGTQRYLVANVGVGAEYKFDATPVSVFASYDFTRTSNDTTSATIDSQRLLVGLRFAIAEDSLLDRDRNGATLKPLPVPLTYSIAGF